jgi:hypothetical protein
MLINKYLNTFYMIVFAALFSIAIVHEGRASTTMNPIEFELIGDGQKTYVSAKLFHYKYTKPVHLEVYSNPDDIGLLALKRYYSSLKSGDVNNITSLFFELDGSYSKIKDLVKENPTMFSKYQQLDKIEVLSKTLWGGYNIYSIRLHAKGQAVDWREELICQKDKCFITRSLDNSDDREKLFEAVYYFLTKRFRPISLSKKQQVKKISQSELSILPSDNVLNLAGNEFPLSFGIYPENYPENSYDFISRKWAINTTQSYPELEVIISMLSELKSINIVNKDFTPLIPIIKKYWINVTENSGFFISLNRLNKKEENKLEIVINDFLLTAFYQTIQSWNSIKPIGKLVSDKITYIIVNVGGENSTSTMQVFALKKDKEGYRLVINNDDDTSAIILNNEFIKLLFKWVDNK